MSPADLKLARAAAAARFLEIAEAIKAEAGVRVHHVRKRLRGRAFPDYLIIEAPEGRTRRQLYILAHECAHIALAHNRKKPIHVQEVEAEKWAHLALRLYGVAVPCSETQRARRYLGSKISRAVRRGAKKIDRAAAAFAKVKV